MECSQLNKMAEIFRVASSSWLKPSEAPVEFDVFSYLVTFGEGAISPFKGVQVKFTRCLLEFA